MRTVINDNPNDDSVNFIVETGVTYNGYEFPIGITLEAVEGGVYYDGAVDLSVKEAEQVIAALHAAIREVNTTPEERLAQRVNGFHVGTRIHNEMTDSELIKVDDNTWYSQNWNTTVTDYDVVDYVESFPGDYTSHGKALFNG